MAHRTNWKEQIGQEFVLRGSENGQKYTVTGINDDNSIILRREDSWTLRAVNPVINENGTIEWDYQTDGRFEDESLAQEYARKGTAEYTRRITEVTNSIKPELIKINNKDMENSKNIKSFYYTFGTLPQYPYEGGWVQVQAESLKKAHEMFRIKFPDVQKDVLNCADFYNEEQFKNAFKNGENRGKGTHETITRESLYNDCAGDIEKLVKNGGSPEKTFEEAVLKYGAERVCMTAAIYINQNEHNEHLSMTDNLWARFINGSEFAKIARELSYEIYNEFTDIVREAYIKTERTLLSEKSTITEQTEKEKLINKDEVFDRMDGDMEKAWIQALLTEAENLPNIYIMDNETGIINEWYFNTADNSLINTAFSAQFVLDYAQIKPDRLYYFFDELIVAGERTVIEVSDPKFSATLDELKCIIENHDYTFISSDSESTMIEITERLINYAQIWGDERKPRLIEEILDELQQGEPEDYGGEKGLKDIEETLGAKSYSELKQDLENMKSTDMEEMYTEETVYELDL